MTTRLHNQRLETVGDQEEACFAPVLRTCRGPAGARFTVLGGLARRPSLVVAAVEARPQGASLWH